jgi:hypothetical protein
MKIVLDIDTVQAPRLEWARVRGIELASPPGASSQNKNGIIFVCRIGRTAAQGERTV